MIGTASISEHLLARLVLALPIALIVAGAIWYGFSAEARQRVRQDLLERPSNMMSFRFFLQPVMAAIAAVRDGVADAKTGRPPYFWTVLTSGSERLGRLEKGLISTSRVLFLGLCMDIVYQLIVLKTFYPVEALTVAIVLAFLPYLLLRGPVARIARLRARAPASDKLR
jgi:hypothetical protein